MGKALQIKQIKSESKLNPKQMKTLKALGLRGVGSVIVRQDLRALRGMLNVIHHIVRVDQVDGPVKKLEKKKKKTFTIVK